LIKTALEEKYPKQKSEDDGTTEDDWEWLDRIAYEVLDLDVIDLDGQYLIGVSLTDGDDYMVDGEYTMKEIEEVIEKLKQIVGEKFPVKLYIGTRPS